ncbi:hypothetical protein GGTG_09472 [Gaeumannomyces tritici R3-111a-1]|uniref:Uncharacterized protein n=1 Tax=Gaeumannomyces tritici (strain R3-111a-1) TaxID=644352 RepID=J3P7I1_GAET3|nr:hypothetical protein GGTG_09472 [Gaeumannomyces tritici R3-111a-1]EJT72612.1 hypothetical protein GGTG_09472 [Gaeumannomyces tritici R3-111a-1]
MTRGTGGCHIGRTQAGLFPNWSPERRSTTGPGGGGDSRCVSVCVASRSTVTSTVFSRK